MLDWVREVNSREQPISPLRCKKNCTQFAVAPLLVEQLHELTATAELLFAERLAAVD